LPEDRVRVIRVLVYEGERSWVEKTLSLSIKGSLITPRGTIKSGTIGDFPDILDEEPVSERSGEPKGSGNSGRLANMPEEMVRLASEEREEAI
jgi:hypothetical protein